MWHHTPSDLVLYSDIYTALAAYILDSTFDFVEHAQWLTGANATSSTYYKPSMAQHLLVSMPEAIATKQCGSVRGGCHLT